MKLNGKLNGFSLKLIAIAAMTLDHIAVLFLNPESGGYLAARIIGRIAFPLFAFLLTEGFFHSSNLKKYMVRLGVLAIVSEPFFDYILIKAELGENFRPWYFQNVVFTLLIGLITIWMYDTVVRKFRNNPLLCNLYCVLILLFGAMLAFWMRTDYSVYGILLIFIMYQFHKNRLWMTIVSSITLLFFGGSSIQLFAVVGVFLIWLYNGEEGKKIKMLFYLFYPLHIALLGILRWLIK